MRRFWTPLAFALVAGSQPARAETPEQVRTSHAACRRQIDEVTRD